MAGVKGRSGRKPKWDDSAIEAAAEDLLLWLEDENNLWFRDWAIGSGLYPEVLSRWSTKNAVFRQAMAVAEMVQEARLVRGGLLNKFNSRIVALCLEHRHNWASRQQLSVETPSHQTFPGSVEEADKQIAELQAHRASLTEMLEQARAVGSIIVNG